MLNAYISQALKTINFHKLCHSRSYQSNGEIFANIVVAQSNGEIFANIVVARSNVGDSTNIVVA